MFTAILGPIFAELAITPEKISEQMKISFLSSLLDIIELYIFPIEY